MDAFYASIVSESADAAPLDSSSTQSWAALIQQQQSIDGDDAFLKLPPAHSDDSSDRLALLNYIQHHNTDRLTRKCEHAVHTLLHAHRTATNKDDDDDDDESARSSAFMSVCCTVFVELHAMFDALARIDSTLSVSQHAYV